MLQAMIEATSVHEAGAADRAPGMPFAANASSHLRNPAWMTGTACVFAQLIAQSE